MNPTLVELEVEPLATPADQTAPLNRLLVVDDEPELRLLLEEYLSRHGFLVHLAADAAQARAFFDQNSGYLDLAILDINMPGENGLSLARWLRDAHPRVAVMMLTTANEVVDRILGLELGADDYLPKPFELRELVARVRAILRRTQAAAPVQPVATAGVAVQSSNGRVRFGTCVLDLELHKLFDAGGNDIAITAAEFDLLALFARHPNRPLNRDHIMEQAHHRGWDVFDRSIDLRIMRLRRKIERNPDRPEVLKTVRNVGYVFVPPKHDER
jgi:two-component system phosphate regulon response regulator OmpR